MLIYYLDLKVEQTVSSAFTAVMPDINVVSLTSFVIVIHAVMCGTLYLKIKLR